MSNGIVKDSLSRKGGGGGSLLDEHGGREEVRLIEGGGGETLRERLVCLKGKGEGERWVVVATRGGSALGHTTLFKNIRNACVDDNGSHNKRNER